MIVIYLVRYPLVASAIAALPLLVFSGKKPHLNLFARDDPCWKHNTLVHDRQSGSSNGSSGRSVSVIDSENSDAWLKVLYGEKSMLVTIKQVLGSVEP